LYLGYNTRALADNGQYETVIGANAIGAGSNSITLGSTSNTKTIINGNLGLGTTNPAAKLTVIGNGSFSTNFSVGGTLTLPQGAVNNYVLTSDASGKARWAAASGGGFSVATNGLQTIGTTAVGLGGTLNQNTNINLSSYNLSFLGAGNTQSLYLASNGSVGIGTTNPTHKLTVISNGGVNGTVFFQNTNTGKTMPTLIVQTGSSGAGFSGTFIEFKNGAGTRIGRIRNTGQTTTTYGTAGTSDFAEYVIGDEPTEPTDLIAYHGDKYGKAVDGQIIAGTHSNYGTFIGNENLEGQTNAFPLTISGIVDVKISSIYGNISPGDPIATSPFPGVAAKATKGGRIVGHAMESYSSNNPNNVGTIKIIVQPTYYDPDVNLTATGQVNINYNVSDSVLASFGYDTTKNEIQNATYSLSGATGKLANFTEIASAKIKAGLISVKNIITNNIVTEKLFAKKTVTDELATNIISPLGNKLEINGNVQIDNNLSVADTLTVTDIQTTQITTEDLTAQNIQTTEVTAEKVTANEASVSTLYADQIISKEGTFADIMAAKISSLREELKNIVASNQEESTPSAIVAESQNWSTSITNDSATITGDMYLTDNLIIGAQLLVNGDTQLGNAFITGQFTAGEVSIADNYIQTTNTALYIQPNNTGSVHIMGDTLVIADNGNVQINGNLNVTGSLFANLLTAAEIETQKLTAAEINSDKINIATDSAAILGTTDIATDSASMIIADNNEINLATNSAQLTSNATAGTATLPSGKTEIIISTNKLTTNSMVYLTPVGSTNNQVLYVKNKVVTPATDTTPIQNYFTISLDNPLTQDIQVNWWIIN